jgi:hypothetical protein
MSRRSQFYMEQERNFSETLNEFVKQWDQLCRDMDEFRASLGGNEDPYRKGVKAKMGSERLGFLTAELMTYHKRINR